MGGGMGGGLGVEGAVASFNARAGGEAGALHSESTAERRAALQRSATSMNAGAAGASRWGASYPTQLKVRANVE